MRRNDVLVSQRGDIWIAPFAQRVPHFWLQLCQCDVVGVAADGTGLPGLHGEDRGETAASGNPTACFGRARHLWITCLRAL